MTKHAVFRTGLEVVTAVSLLGLLCCRNEETVEINLTLAAGLTRTTEIEILEFSGNGPSPYRRRALLTRSVEIRPLVDSLNTDIGLLPNTFCISEYLLHFHLDDGSVREIGYLCSGQARLRWEGQEYEAPPRFVELWTSI